VQADGKRYGCGNRSEHHDTRDRSRPPEQLDGCDDREADTYKQRDLQQPFAVVLDVGYRASGDLLGGLV
jgi:hypothetical protein